jgi:hypothetical protein
MSERKTPALGRVALAAMLVAVLVPPLACGGDDESVAESASVQGLSGLDLDEVASRVEKIRGLEFKRAPRVEVLRQEILEERLEDAERAQVLKDPDRVEREERAAAAEEALLFLLGLVDSKADVAKLGVSDDLEVGGVFLEDEDRVYLEREAVRKDRDEAEKILAHELAHALEDQHFGLGSPRADLGDAAEAARALGEGSASVVEATYADRYLGTRSAESVLNRREERARSADLPPGLVPAIAFPYSDGASFVESLQKAGGRGAVDRAFERTPETTEQILHPQKWIAAEQPITTRIPRSATPGGGWRALGAGDVGEVSTRMILATALPEKAVEQAAAGWGGGAYRTWYRRALPTLDCSQACRRRAAAVLTWAWDDAREAREFDAALTRYLRSALGGTPARGDAWAVKGGAAATAARGDRRALAVAPDERVAQRLATAALEGS